jgi:transposase
MASIDRKVIGGVDTHSSTHHAAVLDAVTGQVLGDQQFPATPAGYRQVLAWLRRHGQIDGVGVEGTGCYGAGLTRHLLNEHITVHEVPRPGRTLRRQMGKSDPIDAVAAARTVIAGQALAIPKTSTGPVEAIRMIHLTRESAVKARTAAINQLKALIVTAPEPLHTQLAGLTNPTLISTCAAFRPDPTKAGDPTWAAKTTLRRLAHRIGALTAEIKQATTELDTLTTTYTPTLRAQPGVGPDVAAQLLITCGDNPHRLRTDAAFARLCGAAPIPASSGQTSRHRLHRGGDRQANRALFTIALSRLAHHPATRAYAQRRTTEGLTKKDILRCLKRYICRDILTAIKTDLNTLAET